MIFDLVISNQMDPWDIDITNLANRYLENVHRMVKINLPLSGKTLFTSSLLLRMKADNIMPKENGHNGHNGHEDNDWENSNYPDNDSYNIPPLTIPLRRYAERKVTIFELVDSLQRALSEELLRNNFPVRHRKKPTLIIKVDEETIKAKIFNLYEHLKELKKEKEVIRFNELLKEHNRRNIIDLLLHLLYLDSKGKIIIWQKRIFGEILITLR